MKRWLRFVSVVMIGALAGCGASRDEGLLSSTRTELANANTAMSTMTEGFAEFMKLKEGNDKKAVEDQKKTLLDAAESYRRSAQSLQNLYRQAESAALKTPEEREKFRAANKTKLQDCADAIATLADTGRKFAAALDSAKKYDKDLTEVFKKLQDADLQFASLKPSVTRTR